MLLRNILTSNTKYTNHINQNIVQQLLEEIRSELAKRCKEISEVPTASVSPEGTPDSNEKKSEGKQKE